MSASDEEIQRLDRESAQGFGVVELQLATLRVKAAYRYAGENEDDAALLRACIDSYMAAHGIDAAAVDRATLSMMRRLQTISYLEGLPD